MMSTLTVSIIILLLCNYISSDTAALTRESLVGSSPDLNQCTDAAQCPVSDACIVCDAGRGPDCEQATCINGTCGVIQQCSQKIPPTTTTPTPSNQCVGTNVSQCVFNRLCKLCIQGLSPPCTQAVCVNNQCKIIPACSIRASTTSTEASITDSCKNDGQCPHPDYCVAQCKDGTGPLCASAKCVNKKCQTISPCSQTTQCTNKNLSRCIVPKICALCKVGLGPSCTQAACVNGQCGIITPCSQTIGTRSTTPPVSTCTCDDECPHPKSCVVKCCKGTTPRCASAKCVNGKCIIIKPCSEHTCETQATCPYNECNCAECPQGYGPECEQPACSCGICSIVPPCSEKITIVVDPLPISND